jgi:ribosome-associated toxin RatA of RatAB toxin-antitoxin module
MKHVRKSVLLWYSAREMFDLVTDFHNYPQFLPWCDSAELVEQHEDGVTARLGLAYMGVRHTFSTRNHNVPGERVAIQLVDGPFTMLDGTWVFVPLGGADAPRPACKIEFDMRYGFSSGALESVLSPVFDRVANTFVDSFVTRAEVVYGPR